MDAECKDLWAQIERRKARMVQSIERLHPGAQMAKQEGRAWSPNMLLEHLVLAEELSLSEIEQGQICRFEAIKRSSKFFKNAALFVLKRGIRVPVGPGMAPTGKHATVDLVGRWNDARARLSQWLEKVEPDVPLSKNSRFGWLTGRDLLLLADAHLQYHERDVMQKR